MENEQIMKTFMIVAYFVILSFLVVTIDISLIPTPMVFIGWFLGTLVYGSMVWCISALDDIHDLYK